MVLFEICPFSINTIFLPALFAANIAAITLSGQFFKQVDSYACKYLAENADRAFDSGSGDIVFDNRFVRWAQKNFVENPAEVEQMLNLTSIWRTIILTAVFVVSELCLIIPLAVSCFLQQSSSEPYPIGVVWSLNAAFVFFILGVVGMFFLLVLKYRIMVSLTTGNIGIDDIERRENMLFGNP